MKKTLVVSVAFLAVGLYFLPKVLAANSGKVLDSKDIWFAKNVNLQNKKYTADLVIVAENIKLKNIDVAGNVFIAGPDVKIEKLKAFSIHILAGNISIRDAEVLNSGYFLSGYLDIKNVRVKHRLACGSGAAFLTNIFAKDIYIGAGNLKASGKADSITIVLNKNSIYDIEGLKAKKLKISQFTPKVNVSFAKKSTQNKTLDYLKNLFIFAVSIFIFAEIIYRAFRHSWQDFRAHEKTSVISTTILGAGLTIVLILLAVLGLLLQHYLHLYFAWLSIVFVSSLIIIYSLLPFLVVVVSAIKGHRFQQKHFKNLKFNIDLYIFIVTILMGLLYFGPLWAKLLYSTLLFGALGDMAIWIWYKLKS